MNYYVLRIKTFGMKNIKEEVCIDFYKETIDKKDNFKDYNIKAIYGANGAGKTALIQSINLYKHLIVNPLYLYQNENIEFLNNLINKKRKEFYINVLFITKDREVLSHEIKIKLNNNIPYIESEKISKLKGNTINGEFELIIEVKNDEIKYIKDNNLNDINNKLNNKSIVTYYNIINNKYLTNTYNFINSILVKVNSLELVNEYDEIKKNEYIQYEKEIKGLYEFIKIFKNELKTIKIEKRINKDKYICKKIFVYKDYQIDQIYESSGIKNLIDLYFYIKEATKDKIVFIDELDVNINGVYLTKLIEYFSEYGNGELCFTTHNVSPMNILKNKKESINFLNNDLEVINWVKNGHYSPINVYEKGLIKGLTFNIEAWDFLKAFNTEE